MPRYMLDTNTVSDLLKGRRAVMQRVSAVSMPQLCISAITGGELLFGLAGKPRARKLHALVTEFLRHVDVLPWDDAAMRHYGPLRARLQQQGMGLSALDMLIAAHALASKSILVTHDAAFFEVPGLNAQDWTAMPV